MAFLMTSFLFLSYISILLYVTSFEMFIEVLQDYI